MSKKIDFNFLHNFLQFIQAKNKWKISEILDNLDISFKELIYILDIVSQIYVDFDDVFVDYEINERFISRACGFVNNYNLSLVLPYDPIDVSNPSNWISDVIILNDSITNENQSHVKILP